MKKTAIYVLLVIIFCALLAGGTYFIFTGFEQLNWYLSDNSGTAYTNMVRNFAFSGVCYLCCIFCALIMIFVYNIDIQTNAKPLTNTDTPKTIQRKIFLNIFLVLNFLTDLILAVFCIYQGITLCYYTITSFPYTDWTFFIIGCFCIVLAVFTFISIFVMNKNNLYNLAYNNKLSREEKKQARIAKLQDELNNLKKD